MDPLSQGTLGAAFTLALWAGDSRLSTKQVALLGALGGMAPDLDVFIRSATDSLLAIEYHRNFTHSLAFVPVGSLLAVLPWLLLKRIRAHWLFAWAVSAVGYATHAPLDCATTYGTLFFWPFSDHRVSLSWVSVVDPLFTLPLLAWVIFAVRRSSTRLARFGCAYALGYLSLGAAQNWRAEQVQARLAQSRGHVMERRDVFTTFLNQVTWRSVYESQGRLYVDQIRVPYLGTTCTKEGASIAPARAITTPEGPLARRGHRLLSWFSSGWVAQSPEDPSFFFDVRYSAEPSGVSPFWGVRFSEAQDGAEWVNTRNERTLSVSSLWDRIFKNPPGSVCDD